MRPHFNIRQNSGGCHYLVMHILEGPRVIFSIASPLEDFMKYRRFFPNFREDASIASLLVMTGAR
jgi:hypothetical protein